MKIANVLKALLWIFFLTYGLLLVTIFLLQHKLMYFPSSKDNPPEGRSPFVPWVTNDDEFLGYTRESGVVKRVVVFFHGNGGEALDRSWLSALFPSDEVAIVLAEYPGYGAKGGRPSEESIYEAAKELMAAVRERFAVPITLMGESIGSSVACAMAKSDGVDRLALISPFPSAVAVAEKHYFYLPVRWLMRDRFAACENLRDVNLPLHVIHGTDDFIVPFALGKELFDKYEGQKKSFTTIPDAAHNDMASRILMDEKAEEFRKFARGN